MPMKSEEIEILQIIQKFGEEIHLNPFLLETFGLDSSFDKDLGLDSLARMELISQVEGHFKISLPEDVFASVETPRDLLRAIMASGKKVILKEATTIVRELSDLFPGESSTLLDILDWHYKKHPDSAHIKICLENNEEEIITFRQLWEESGKVASALVNQFEVLPNKKIALMLPMGRDYFFIFMGVIRAGAVPVPLYPPYNLRQVQTHILRHCNILENCNAIMMITVSEAIEVSEIIQSRVSHLERIVTPVDLYQSGKEPIEGGFRPSPNSTAFIQYTSGSTGTPKGVVLSHENLICNIRAMGSAINASSKDVFVSWLPLYHDMGLIGAWFGSLYFSCLLVIMSPLSFLAHPIRWLRVIHENKGTITAAPNFAYELCLKRIKEEELAGIDLSSLRVVFNGAEQVSSSTITKFNQRFLSHGFNPDSFMPVYGLAENSLGLTFPKLGRGPLVDSIDREKFLRDRVSVPSKDKNSLKFLSCGQPLENFQVKIVDEQGKELASRQIGQIQFCGPSATSGYYRNPEATKKLFDGEWLNTGDLGYMAEGELYITGRIKDIIIHGGRNLFPEEIEQSIGEIEGIRKGCVAIFGSYEPEKGTERLVVIAETRETDSSVLGNLQKKINAQVSELVGAAPEVVVLAPPHSVLKTLNGKLRRSATRELFEKGNIGKGERYIWMLYAQIFSGTILNRLRGFYTSLTEIIYGIYFWIMVILFSIPSLVLVIIIPLENIRWKFIRFVLKALSWTLGITTTISGLEKLNIPSIIISNHASYLDGFILAMSLPFKLCFVAKGELKSNFFLSLILNRLNTKFVERFDIKKGAEEILQMESDIPVDRPILFFPEGTFIQKPGLLPFKMGAFVLSTDLGFPLIPLSIRGSRAILPADTWIPKRGNISINIGTQILPESKGWEGALELSNTARKQILLHCGEPDLSYEKSPLFKMKT